MTNPLFLSPSLSLFLSTTVSQKDDEEHHQIITAIVPKIITSQISASQISDSARSRRLAKSASFRGSSEKTTITTTTPG